MIANVRRRAISVVADMTKASTQQRNGAEGKLYFPAASEKRGGANSVAARRAGGKCAGFAKRSIAFFRETWDTASRPNPMRYPLFAALLGVTVAAFVSILNAVFLAPEGYEDESGFRFGGMPSGPADVGVSAIAHS